MKNTLSQFDTTRKKWIGDLHELIACTVLILCLAVELHRVLDGNLDLRLEGRVPPVSPTSGIPYAGSDLRHMSHSMPQSLERHVLVPAEWLQLVD
jgi:hypothetical protein